MLMETPYICKDKLCGVMQVMYCNASTSDNASEIFGLNFFLLFYMQIIMLKNIPLISKIQMRGMQKATVFFN